MPNQRRTVRSGHALAVAFVALSVSGFGPAVQAFAQDAPPPGDATLQDPPSRVGYVSLIEGTVSMHPNATDPWAPASINYPLTAGTSLWTEPGAKAEIQIGAARVDLDGGTEVDIVAVDDQNVDISVPQGRADVHLHGRQPTESYEVTVPRGTTALAVDGTYRIIAGDDQAPTRIGALYGTAQLIEPGGTVPVQTNNELIVTAGDPLAYTQQAIQDDAFDHWVADRMHGFERPAAQSAQYVSPQVVGAESLAQYGTWQPSPEYGSVWYPTGVSASWAPYREGHWAWVAPWGWTWVDDAPWGFAPFHYGRWAQFDGRWGWVPGERVARPVYAPAMVTFVGGAPGVGIGVSVGIGVGIGAAIGWIPLGPREVYHPPYRVSDNYIRNVNVTNVHVTNVNIRNTNVTYVNQHAVTAVDHDAFVGARPVGRAALPAAQAAAFTHPIAASAGRPGAAAPALPQPTVASRVGPEAAGRPVQAPPQARLQMPTTHLNGQGRVVPTAVPAPAAAAPRPGPAGAPVAGVPQPHGPAAPTPAVARPTGAPQPHPLAQPAPHPGAAPGAVPQPNAAAPHPVAQPHAPTPPQPAAGAPHPQPQAQQPHPQVQQPHPQAQPQQRPAPQAQPHPQAQPQPQPRPQGQQPRPAPRPEEKKDEKKDEHPTSFHQPAGHQSVQPAHAAPRPAPQRQPEHKENRENKPT